MTDIETETDIETDRLLLRMFSPGDLDDLATIFSDPDVVRYIGDGKPAPREDTERALHSIIKHWECNGFGRWAAVYKPTRELIGYGGLRSFNGTPELVYLLSRAYWGRGLATEMAKACLKFGFEERMFEQVIAMAKTPNTASQRVMQKAGMMFDRKARVFGIDVICYQITRDAYLSGSSPYARLAADSPTASRRVSPVI